MDFKTIIVHVADEPDAEARVRAACDVAATFDAAVLGVGAAGWDRMLELEADLAEPWVAQALRTGAEAELAAAEAIFRRATYGHPHGVIWQARTVGGPDSLLIEAARCGDLVILGREAPRPGRRSVDPGRLIMQAGLPVLLVPAGQETVAANRAVIAWKNTRETRRAVGDALPFLKRAQVVTLARISESETADEGRRDLAEVVDRLARHGVNAEVDVREPTHDSMAEDLRRLCLAHDADLLITGAYGRSRLQEWAFGGVTADLLAHAALPVLFSR